MSHPHPELTRPAPARRRAACGSSPLGGLGEVGRNMTVFEYDGPAARRRLRRAVPRGPPPRRRPDPARLRLHRGPARRRRGARAHPRPRGPHRRRARTCCALQAPTSRWSARSSPSPWSRPSCASTGSSPYTLGGQGGQTRAARRRSTASSSRSTTRSPTRSPSPSAPPAGTVLHTGDFKMDQLPLDGRLTDLRAFARLGEEGVDLFLADSTNAEVPGFTTPETRHRPGARPGLPPRRSGGSSWPASPPTCTACSRCSTPPRAHGRKVAFVGRSMVRNMGIAADLGYLHVPDGVLVDVKELDDLPDDQVVLISTGSQGEPMAALSRMANRDHRIDVGAGDTVILASSLIPGNENAVYRVINGLMRARRQRRAQGQRHGARLRATPAPASCSTATTSSSRATSCRCTASGATCVANAELAVQTGVAARAASCSPRTASSSTSSTASAAIAGAVALRLRLRRRLVGRRRSPRRC